MRGTILGSVLAAALAAGLPSPAPAQSAAGEWWEWAAPLVVGGQEIPTRRGTVVVPDRRGDVWNDRRTDRRSGAARGNQRAPGNAPAFCRSGAGHPVHGRQWCLDKGWGLGGQRYDPRWERRGWEDVIFRAPRDRRTSGALDQVTLIDVLGSVVFGRLDGHRHRLGLDGPVTGRWTAAETGGRVLQLRSGAVPLAELTDLDGDGRVDLVLVYGGS